LWGNNKTGDVLAMASEIVAARASTAPAEAIAHWQRAVAAQDAFTYDEPPAWYYPVRESLGAALLRAGRAAEAEAVFREGNRRSPRNGRMLFGLMESLRAQHKTEAAEAVRREFEAAWAKADIKLRIEDL
jgi:tetratricopeptide (TPR) repeat protein